MQIGLHRRQREVLADTARAKQKYTFKIFPRELVC